MGIKDIPLIEHTPQKQVLSSDWFIKYKELCHKFMSTLTDSIEEVAFMNLSQDDFMAIVMGRRAPQNTSFKLRIPLSLGGDLDISNMFMCYTFPHAQIMDRFIIEQSGNETIWLPNPAKKIYIPANMGGGGTGGNATEDRLAQMAAQIAAERGV